MAEAVKTIESITGGWVLWGMLSHNPLGKQYEISVSGLKCWHIPTLSMRTCIALQTDRRSISSEWTSARGVLSHRSGLSIDLSENRVIQQETSYDSASSHEETWDVDRRFLEANAKTIEKWAQTEAS